MHMSVLIKERYLGDVTAVYMYDDKILAVVYLLFLRAAVLTDEATSVYNNIVHTIIMVTYIHTADTHNNIIRDAINNVAS